MASGSAALDDWLNSAIKSNPPGWQLPTDAALTGMFKVSRSTVIRRMNIFCAAGSLVRIQGKGTFTAPVHTTGPNAPPPSLSASEILASRLTEFIISGELKEGEAMPAVKYMAIRFRNSFKTVMDAYRKLEKRELISRMGKTYWVGNGSELLYPARGRELYFFTYRHNDFTYNFDPSILGQAYRRMETELHGRGCVVRYANSDTLRPLVKSWRRSGRYPHGLLFTAFHESYYKALRPDLKWMSDTLGAFTPALMFDWEEGIFSKDIPDVQLFMRGNVLTTASRTLIRYLLRKRFGSTVIFMSHSGRVWSFPGDSLPLLRIIWEMKKADPSFIFKPVIRPSADDKNGLHLRDKLPRQCEVHSQQVFPKVKEGDVSDLVRRTGISTDFGKEFAKFRKSPLWIFDRDADAAAALAWAEKNRIRVPEDLSVMTLENGPRHLYLGLTYSGPDWDTIGYQMAHAVIRDYPVAKTSKGFLKTKAVVLEKLTTR